MTVIEQFANLRPVEQPIFGSQMTVYFSLGRFQIQLNNGFSKIRFEPFIKDFKAILTQPNRNCFWIGQKSISEKFQCFKIFASDLLESDIRYVDEKSGFIR